MASNNNDLRKVDGFGSNGVEHILQSVDYRNELFHASFSKFAHLGNSFWQALLAWKGCKKKGLQLSPNELS